MEEEEQEEEEQEQEQEEEEEEEESGLGEINLKEKFLRESSGQDGLQTQPPRIPDICDQGYSTMKGTRKLPKVPRLNLKLGQIPGPGVRLHLEREKTNPVVLEATLQAPLPDPHPDLLDHLHTAAVVVVGVVGDPVCIAVVHAPPLDLSRLIDEDMEDGVVTQSLVSVGLVYLVVAAVVE